MKKALFIIASMLILSVTACSPKKPAAPTQTQNKQSIPGLTLPPPVIASATLMPTLATANKVAPTQKPTATSKPTVGVKVKSTATKKPASSGTAVCNCTGPDLNCKDFKNHRSAQSCYDYCKSQGYGDIFHLDADHDGKVCESLP